MLTIAQFSFWGNYLPRVYPTYLRGTGESFAANVGGRMLKSNTGILSAFDARTGAPHFQNRRLDDVPEVFSSPVAAAGRVYVTGRDGVTLVLQSGTTFELLKKNALEDGFDASPALADRQLFLRGHKYLYALAAN